MSMIARVTDAVREPRSRRLAYAVLALLLAALCVIPRPYVARAKLVPQDSNSVGLGSMMNALGGQLQGFAAPPSSRSTCISPSRAARR